MWWSFIISKRGEFHNDWWVFISEDIKSWEEDGVLKVLYTTDLESANFVYNIWTGIAVLCLIIVILACIMCIYSKFIKRKRR